MKKQNKNLWIPTAIIIGIVLLIVILLYYFFKTESLKNYKSDLKDELRQLRRQIRQKERNVHFLSEELRRLRAAKECIVDYAIRLYSAIKIIILLVLISTGVAVYVLYSFNILEAISIITPIVLICYHGITVCIKNRVGDFGKTLQFVQDYFVDIVFHLKKFDVSLISTIEEKLLKETAELEGLKLQLAVRENYKISNQ
jgi:multisubunit Na+/H+ antiporter MnhC subunit